MCEIFGRHVVIIQAVVDKRTVYADRDEIDDQFRNKKRASDFAKRAFPENTEISVFSVPVVKSQMRVPSR